MCETVQVLRVCLSVARLLVKVAEIGVGHNEIGGVWLSARDREVDGFGFWAAFCGEIHDRLFDELRVFLCYEVGERRLVKPRDVLRLGEVFILGV